MSFDTEKAKRTITLDQQTMGRSLKEAVNGLWAFIKGFVLVLGLLLRIGMLSFLLFVKARQDANRAQKKKMGTAKTTPRQDPLRF